MNVVKCEIGHFYDADVYAVCPHCTDRDKAETKGKKKSGKFFLFGKNKAAASASETAEEPPRKAFRCPPTELMTPEKVPAEVPSPTESAPKAPVCAGADGKEPKGADTSFAGGKQRTGTACEEKKTDNAVSAACEEKKTDNAVPAACEEKKAAQSSPLPTEHTVGFFCEAPASTAPCVGWLVGLSGPYRGISMEIKPGGNTVGRGDAHRINLSLDNRVSRDPHAYLVYEPRERKFYIDSGRSSGLSYVNGKVILHRAVLSQGDIVEIGGGKYLFVPLCSDTFSWDSIPAFQPICREGT